jgi:predicted thioredoxin/glutaredoxin
MTSLLQRLVRRQKAPPVAVTVYTRRECCCCHTALDVLETFRRKYHLVIEPIDIDGDPELAAAHGLSVPVVAIDGKVRFKGVVNPILLKRLLDAR